MFRTDRSPSRQEDIGNESPITAVSSTYRYNFYAVEPDTLHNFFYFVKNASSYMSSSKDPFFEALDFRSKILNNLPEGLQFLQSRPKSYVPSFIGSKSDEEIIATPSIQVTSCVLDVNGEGNTPAYSLEINANLQQFFEKKWVHDNNLSIIRGASPSYNLKDVLAKEVEENITSFYCRVLMPLVLKNAINVQLFFHLELFGVDVEPVAKEFTKLLLSHKGIFGQEFVENCAKKALESATLADGSRALSDGQISSIVGKFSQIKAQVDAYVPDTGLVSTDSSTKTEEERAKRNEGLLTQLMQLLMSMAYNFSDGGGRLVLHFDPKAKDKDAQDEMLKHELKILSDELARVDPSHPVIAKIAPFLEDGYKFGDGSQFEELKNQMRAITHQDPAKEWERRRLAMGVKTKTDMGTCGFELRRALQIFMQISFTFPLERLHSTTSFDPSTLSTHVSENGEVELSYSVHFLVFDEANPDESPDPQAVQKSISAYLVKNPPQVSDFRGQAVTTCNIAHTGGGNYEIQISQILRLDDPMQFGSLYIQMPLDFLNQKNNLVEIANIRLGSTITEDTRQTITGDTLPSKVQAKKPEEEKLPEPKLVEAKKEPQKPTLEEYMTSQSYFDAPPSVPQVPLANGIGLYTGSIQTTNRLPVSSNVIDLDAATSVPPLKEFAPGFVAGLKNNYLTKAVYEIDGTNSINLFLNGGATSIFSQYPHSPLYATWESAVGGLLDYNRRLLGTQATLPNGILAGDHYMDANLRLSFGGINSFSSQGINYGRLGGRFITDSNTPAYIGLGSGELNLSMKNKLFKGIVEVSTNVGANLFYSQQDSGRADFMRFIGLSTQLGVNTKTLMEEKFGKTLNLPLSLSATFGGGFDLEEGRGSPVLKGYYFSAGLQTKEGEQIVSFQWGREGLNEQGPFVSVGMSKNITDALSAYMNYGISSGAYGSADHLFFGIKYEFPLVKPPSLMAEEQTAELELQRQLAINVLSNCNNAISLLKDFDKNGFKLAEVKGKVKALELDSQNVLSSISDDTYRNYVEKLLVEYTDLAQSLKSEIPGWDKAISADRRYPKMSEAMLDLKQISENSNRILITPLVHMGTIVGAASLYDADNRLYIALRQTKNISSDVPNIDFLLAADLDAASKYGYLGGLYTKTNEYFLSFSDQISSLNQEQREAFYPPRKRILVVGNGGESELSAEGISLLAQTAQILNMSFDFVFVGDTDQKAIASLTALSMATGGVVLDKTALDAKDFLNPEDTEMDMLISDYLNAIGDDNLIGSEISLQQLWGLSASAPVGEMLSQMLGALANTKYVYGGKSNKSGRDCSGTIWATLVALDAVGGLAIDGYDGRYRTATGLYQYFTQPEVSKNFISNKVASSYRIISNKTTSGDIIDVSSFDHIVPNKSLAYADPYAGSELVKKKVTNIKVSEITSKSNFELRFRDDKKKTYCVQNAMDKDKNPYLMIIPLKNESDGRVWQKLGEFLTGPDGDFNGRYYNLLNSNLNQFYVTAISGGKNVAHAGFFTRLDSKFEPFSLSDADLSTKLAALVPDMFNIPDDATAMPPVWSDDKKTCIIEFNGWNASAAHFGRYTKAFIELNFETGAGELRKYEFDGKKFSRNIDDVAIFPFKVEGSPDYPIISSHFVAYVDMTSDKGGAHQLGDGGLRKKTYKVRIPETDGNGNIKKHSKTHKTIYKTDDNGNPIYIKDDFGKDKIFTKYFGSGLYLNPVTEKSLQIYNGKNPGTFTETFHVGEKETDITISYTDVYKRSKTAMGQYFVFGPLNMGGIDINALLESAAPLATAYDNLQILKEHVSGLQPPGGQ